MPPAQRLVVATRNRNKVRELAPLLGGLDVELLTLADLPELPEVVEDRDTFAENASRKAREIAAATGLPVLADDSGLEVDALGGAPGVLSARYAGTGHDDRVNNARLLAELAGVPPERRTARFRCAIALADRWEDTLIVREGACEGVILEALRGGGGFGYDPLFLYPPLGRTFAELGMEEKNRLSHRARAIAAIMPEVRAHLARRLAAGRP
jgi:XTP/dITP diphosphohydrolase